MRNVKDYGAVGDGKALDTAAIQKAIDAGGMVYFPAGTYRTGTIYLKSNGGLHLEANAVILASHDNKDYNADDYCVQNRVFASEHVTGEHLISAVEQENVTIEGQGTINGEGNYWMNDSDTYGEDNDYTPVDNRPAQMIFFCECRGVRVQNVNIVNAPYWHLFFHGCENVLADGLHIEGDRPRWTNDGIDIDCCSNVTVSNCTVDVGDDALTLRGFCDPLKRENRICENVTVTNCVLRAARDNGVRIGVGRSLVTDCVLSNLIVEAPRAAGFSIEGRWNEKAKSASRIENILFSNIAVKAETPFYISVANGEKPLETESFIRNLSFTSILIEGKKTSTIKGFKDIKAQNITFNSVMVSSRNKALPLFEVSEADNIRFDGCCLIRDECVKVEDASTVTFNNQ